MSQPLSIRFQPPEQLTGSAKDLLAVLRRSPQAEPIAPREDNAEPLALPRSRAQEQANIRALRQRLRNLEKQRALKSVAGTATWIITDRMSVNPDLGERIGHAIVGAGVGKGHIVFGPPDLCLPSGLYTAIIEFQVTDMLHNRAARMIGEVILDNTLYLSWKTKTIRSTGCYAFHLPFRVFEDDLLRHSTPLIQVRLNLKSIMGIKVTQVAVVSSAPGIRSAAYHSGANLMSIGNKWLRWFGRRIVKSRA